MKALQMSRASSRLTAPGHWPQDGMTLVELLIGMAVGLFLLAGAAMVLTTQLDDNRRLLLETQLQQDVRASMDIITRDLRRAGSSAQAADSVWHPLGPVPADNGLAAIALTGGDTVQFQVQRDGDRQGPWGFRLNRGRIQSLLGAAGWQELTDRTVMEVTAFEVTEASVVTEQMPCPKACSADLMDTACWPTLTVRTYAVHIEARSAQDSTVRHRQSSRVRVRNDALNFGRATVCPA